MKSCKQCGEKVINGEFCTPECCSEYANGNLRSFRKYVNHDFLNTCNEGSKAYDSDGEVM
jgi:hypothetical protein